MRFVANRASAAKFAKAFALHKHGRLHEAELAYAAILKRDPSQVDALHRLGLIKKEQGRKTEAHALLTAALARCGDAKPGVADSADVLIKRGEILHALDRYFEAVVSYDRALTLAPDRADCHVNRGFSLYYLDRLQAALASYDRALALAPRDATILFYRAQTLRRLDRYEEALADLDQTLTRKPDFAPAYNLRGETLASLARYDEAAAQFELALKHDPKFMPARLNLGLTRLLRGDFHRGWRDYEFRWSSPRAERREFRAPLWLGDEPLVGKTILLHAEQGFGDTIQFARYAALAAERGAKVILEVQAELKTLMSRIGGSCRGPRPARGADPESRGSTAHRCRLPASRACRRSIAIAPCSACRWRSRPTSTPFRQGFPTSVPTRNGRTFGERAWGSGVRR